MACRLRKDERRAQILDALRYTPHLRITSLAERFAVTTETVRRDIDALSETGLVDRAHGGAVARPMAFQPSISEREQSTVEERRRIAATAAQLVSAGQVVMIDAGSTTSQLAWHLNAVGERLRVITNSYPVASALASANLRAIVCPGDFNGREGGVFGQDTSEFLSRFHGNVAFIGASGIAADGISDVHREAAWVKRTMLARCERAYLLVDHSKFDTRLLEIVAPLDDLDGIVTDRAPQGPLARQLDKAGVAVHVADEPAATSVPAAAGSSPRSRSDHG